MKYVYDANLEIQHVSLGDRLACYWKSIDHTRSSETGVMLIQEEGKYAGYDYVVASFKDGYCNNASCLTYQKAWDLFLEILKELRQEEFAESADFLNAR